MKLIVVFSLFFSLSALACPDLTGTWECPETLGNNNDLEMGRVKIGIKTKNNVPVYTFASVDDDGKQPSKISYKIDGKPHKTKDEKIPYVGSCRKNEKGQSTLVLDSKWIDDRENYFLQEYTLLSDKEISVRLNQNVWGESDVTVVCKKVN